MSVRLLELAVSPIHLGVNVSSEISLLTRCKWGMVTRKHRSWGAFGASSLVPVPIRVGLPAALRGTWRGDGWVGGTGRGWWFLHPSGPATCCTHCQGCRFQGHQSVCSRRAGRERPGKPVCTGSAGGSDASPPPAEPRLPGVLRGKPEGSPRTLQSGKTLSFSSPQVRSPQVRAWGGGALQDASRAGWVCWWEVVDTGDCVRRGQG